MSHEGEQMTLGNQRGEGRMGFLISAAILGIGIFLAVKIIPVRIDAYDFRDTIREECRMGAVRKNDTVIFERIMAEAQELDIPLIKKNLKVVRSAKRLRISATYEKPIDLKVTTYIYRFSVDEEAPLF